MNRLTCIITLFVMTACGISRQEEKKDFYNSISGWDIQHVPIFPPFRATSTYPGMWSITGADNIRLSEHQGGNIPVATFGVSKNYIYGTSDNGQWFLFNTTTLVYCEYGTEKELDLALDIYKLDHNPVDSCTKYFEQLYNGKRCYWFPEKGNNYPAYEDYRPDPCITLEIEGEKTITGFKLSDKIKRTATRIYYFKVKYAKKENDRFYITIGYSAPRLIKDGDLIPAVSGNNSNLEVHLYTLYEGKKKTPEKDKLDISKLVFIE